MSSRQRKTKLAISIASFVSVISANFTAACSTHATFSSNRTHVASAKAGTANATTPKQPAKPAPENGQLKLPDSLPVPVSPFAKSKLFLAPKGVALTDQGGSSTITIIYKDADDCAKSVGALPGFTGARIMFNGEYTATANRQDEPHLAALAATPCIIGIADNPSMSLPATTTPTRSTALALAASDANSIIGFDASTKAFFSSLTKAKVAIIDSGIDLKNDKFADVLAKDLRATTAFSDLSTKQMIYGDVPMDEFGHGTEVASVIAHPDFGLATQNVELIPIKVTQDGVFDDRALIAGINEAVNKGADIVSLSAGGNSLGCDPAVGYVIQKAVEKGVFFVLAAGNGIGGVGFPIVGATEDGPASYQETFSPACWSRYFLGVVSAAALSDGTTSLAPFSNYSDDIELSAPGTNVQAVGLNGAKSLVSGTSFAAPIVTSAAALAVAFNRSKHLAYAPWYIENLLVESANKAKLQASQERRARAGSIVNFTNLAALLKKSESMTDEQRRNDIPTISPRDGTGWHPGTDIANLKLLRLDLLKSTAHPGDVVPFKITAFYIDDSQKDVTASTDAVLSFSNSKLISLQSPGMLHLGDVSAFGFSDPGASVSLTIKATYSEQEAQVFNSANLIVSIADVKPTDIHIVPPASPLRVGQTVNQFTLVATNSSSSSTDPVDLTGSSVWASSEPKEFVFVSATGVADLSDAVSGKAYTVTATYKGVPYTFAATIVDESVSSFQIHSFLGEASTLEAGQQLVVEPHFVLGSSREVALPGLWFLADKALGTGGDTARLTVDTTGLSPGIYALRSVATFRSVHGNKDYEDTYQFTIGDGIDHISVELKTPIVTIGQDFQIDLRSYLLNNSYTVVTGATTWTSDQPGLVTINSAGIGHVDSKLKPTTVHLTAHYMNHDTAATLQAVAVSTVTGSSSDLDHIELQLTSGGYCSYPNSKVLAVYKDKSTRAQISQSVSYAHLNASGQWENTSLPLFGGETYRVTVTYNDGNTSVGGGGNGVVSSQITLPIVPLDHLNFVDKVSMKIGAKALPSVSTSDDVCTLDSATASPTEMTAGVIYKTVSFSSAKIGIYIVTASATYTGEGTRKKINGSFTVNVDPAKPTTLTIANSNSTVPGQSPYGDQRFHVELLDQEKQELAVNPGDVSFQLFVNGAAVNPNDPRVFLSSVFRNDANFAIYPASLDASYRVLATHIASGLTAEVTFSLEASWEVVETSVSTMPAATPPPINEVIDPACLTRLAAQPMTGTGYPNDPFVICQEADLKILSTTFTRGLSEYSYKLGANIDFNGRSVEPILGNAYRSHLDGAGHSIANFVIIDSERDNLGLFSGMESISNIFIVNPTVRGHNMVGAVAAALLYGDHIYVIGGSVWGALKVGGIIGFGQVVYNHAFSDLGVYGTEVRYELGFAGGLIGAFEGVYENFNSDLQTRENLTCRNLVFTGTIESAGVPGNSYYIGGLVGWADAIKIKNSVVTGTISTLNASYGETAVGGLVGFGDSDVEIYDSEFSGLVVSTGSSVGGIIGVDRGINPFGFNHAEAFTFGRGNGQDSSTVARRGGVLVRNNVSGSVWGGMSREQLQCLGDKDLVIVLGKGGSTTCTGDILKQVGGQSNVGGIVGTASLATLQENSFTGKARGISAVGGIVGTASVSNFVRNNVKGLVSASQAETDYGALAGTVANSGYLKQIPSRLDGNLVGAGQGTPAWTIGNNLGVLQQTVYSNVPTAYPKN